jgi:hypothetical protein
MLTDERLVRDGAGGHPIRELPAGCLAESRLLDRRRLGLRWEAGDELAAEHNGTSTMSEHQTLEDGVVELLRKKAALAGQVAFHHFRLLSALKAAAAHARRTGNVLDADDLDDQHRAIDVYSQHVSNVADNSHAARDALRQNTSSRTLEPWQWHWR